MRYVVFGIMLILLAGFFHIMFIMFDNVWYNDTNGVFTLIPEKLNSSLTSVTRNSTWNTTNVLQDAFGYARVICIGLVVVCFVLEAVDRPRIQG